VYNIAWGPVIASRKREEGQRVGTVWIFESEYGREAGGGKNLPVFTNVSVRRGGKIDDNAVMDGKGGTCARERKSERTAPQQMATLKKGTTSAEGRRKKKSKLKHMFDKTRERLVPKHCRWE